MKMLKQNWNKLAAGLSAALIFGIGIIVSAWADTPPPVLKISSLGSNQFSILITNGVTNVNYVLYGTPLLNNPNYPWELLTVGELGETNWIVDGGEAQYLFFRVITGTDWDSDGIVNWQDANPTDPNFGILTLTIDSPLNGAVLQ